MSMERTGSDTGRTTRSMTSASRGTDVQSDVGQSGGWAENLKERGQEVMENIREKMGMGSDKPTQSTQSTQSTVSNVGQSEINNPLAPGGNPASGTGTNEPYTGAGHGDRLAGRSSNI